MLTRSLCLCVCQDYLSVCLSVCQDYLSVCLSVCQDYLSVCLSVYLSACETMRLSDSLLIAAKAQS
jgi:hypothetical protein